MSRSDTSSKLRVVVADDESSIRLHTRLLLRGIGIRQVEMAADGREALGLIEREGGGIDLLILDVMMPGMDGVELMNRLAQSEFTGAIILMTASTAPVREMATLYAESLGLRFLGMVKKPLTEETLVELLESRDRSAA